MNQETTAWKTRIRSHYDRCATAWIAHTEKEPLAYYYGTYFKTLFTKGIGGQRALDIGCGAGTFTFELAKHPFQEIHAIDLSPNMLQCMHGEIMKRGLTHITLHQGDIEHIPCPDQYFDVVVAVGIMELLPHKQQALQEIFRVLKPGGKALIRWLNREGIWGTVESLRRKVGLSPVKLPINCHSKLQETTQIISTAGFHITRLEGMILMPFFIFPFPISRLFEIPLIYSKLAYRLEGRNSRGKKTIKRWYYSYCTELVKPAEAD